MKTRSKRSKKAVSKKLTANQLKFILINLISTQSEGTANS